MRICQSHFFVVSGENQKSSLGQRRKSIPDLICFWVTFCNLNVHVRGYKIGNLHSLCSCSVTKLVTVTMFMFV